MVLAEPPGNIESLSRTYRLGAAALVLLAMTVALGIHLGSQTRAQFGRIEGGWSDYAGDVGQKGVWISSLRGYLGYGGIIHNFKNYVLRQDQVYLERTREQIAQFEAVMAVYLAEVESPQERAALEVIRGTISAYAAKLPIAVRAAEEGWAVARTDRLVKVDDSAAVRALEELEAIWRSRRAVSTGRIVTAVGEGERLIWVGFAALAALMLAALVLGLLLALLLRDLRNAVQRLSRELAARRRIEQSEKRLAEAVEQSPATIFITDTDARILYANRRFEALTGWRREAIEGQTPRILQSGDTPPEVYAEIRARLARGESWQGVFRNRRRDGGSYWAETTIVPLRGPDGEVRNFIGIAEDITEKRAAREQVARAQKLEAVGLLAGGIAHDFNNILTTIIGAAHLAGLDAPKASDLSAEIEQIEIAARRGQSLVRGLLTFARREPGRPEPNDLGAVVTEATRLLRASVPPTVTLECDQPAAPVMVMADHTHLHQIVMNLCRNAAEAIGGAPGGIRITTARLEGEAPEGLPERRDGWVELRVADDGPGMTEETRGRLFDPFYTTKPLGKGSGLGLAVVSGLVQEMGGRIAVESRPGEGAEFRLVLPGAPVVATLAEADGDELPRARGRERLVLVDDEPEVAATYRRVLLRLGYRVDAFTSPRIALDHVRADPQRLDLLVTDMVMPGLNGEELAAALRKLRADLPVIFCSGYAPAGITLSEPKPVVLNKPVDPGELARRVRAMLDAAKMVTPA